MTAAREVGKSGPNARRYVVARASDVQPGEHLLIEVDGREIGLFNVDGEFYALLNRCPHRAGPLCEGDLIRFVIAEKVGEVRLGEQVMLTCPWHAWEFDIRTGQSWWDPAKTRGRTYPVKVESGEAVRRELASASAQRLPGPYVADVIPTVVEEDYIVVTMRRRVEPTETDAAL
jgi:nitrite reductase/ring-hydroxylating ferredoxin subunit